MRGLNILLLAGLAVVALGTGTGTGGAVSGEAPPPPASDTDPYITIPTPPPGGYAPPADAIDPYGLGGWMNYDHPRFPIGAYILQNDPSYGHLYNVPHNFSGNNLWAYWLPQDNPGGVFA